MTALLRAAGHVATVLPTLFGGLAPRPPSTVGFVPIVDDWFGPTRLGASLRVPDGAEAAVVLVHGLGGHRNAAYVRSAAALLHRLGFATLALDLRGADRCGGGFYHVAQTADLAAACASPLLRPFRRLFVLGFSMGGHVAIHFAAAPTDARLGGVAALCTPLDLEATQRHLDRPANWLYRRFVLHGLQQIYAAVAARHAVPTPAREVWRCRTFHDWDRLTIAPRYGHDSPASFYAANSARLALPRLQVDTTLVLAQHDPIVPPALAMPWLAQAPVGRLHAVVLARGGHLHFPRGQCLGLGGDGAGSVVAQLATHWGAVAAATVGGVGPPAGCRRPGPDGDATDVTALA